MRRIAIIPARGGSRRIPGKNIRPFLGAPMLAWPVAVARRSALFDQVIVSTDDEGIAKVARAAGAQTIERPAELADDHTGVADVVRHVLADFAGEELAACLIYATAPFLRRDDLRRGYAELSHARFALAVTSFAFPVQRALLCTQAGGIAMLDPRFERSRSQDLPEAYHDAGLFVWGSKSAWLSGEAIYGPGTAPVVIPRHRVQDIDTPEDWARAELMARLLIETGEIETGPDGGAVDRRSK